MKKAPAHNRPLTLNPIVKEMKVVFLGGGGRHINTCVYIHVHMCCNMLCVYTYIYICAYMSLCVYVDLYICICVHMYIVFIHTHVDMSARKYVYMYVLFGSYQRIQKTPWKSQKKTKHSSQTKGLFFFWFLVSERF